MLTGWSKTDKGIGKVKTLGTEASGNEVVSHRSGSVAVDKDSEARRCKDGNFTGKEGAKGRSDRYYLVFGKEICAFRGIF